MRQTDPRLDTDSAPSKARGVPRVDSRSAATKIVISVAAGTVHGRAGNPYVPGSVQVSDGGFSQEPQRNLALRRMD